MQGKTCALSGALLVAALFAPAPAAALPSCSELAAIASTSPGVQSITSVLTPAAGSNAAYCQVNLKYVREINIRVGLPLSAADGGTGGTVDGAWSGRIRNLGGGGLVGTVGAVTNATNTRSVGSSTDSGHNNAVCAANGHPNCEPGGAGFVLDANNNLIWSQIQDFVYVSVIEQVRWAKRLTKLYYGIDAQRNYWDGCSTGGRQGMEMAQRYGDQFDGILAGAPVMAYSRQGTGALWIGTVLKDYFGDTGLSTAKINAANAAAIAACDGNDGIVDGLVNEPRRCAYSAQALKCTGGPGEPATCLTQQEADAIDKVWDGARNQKGQRLWGGPPRGASWTMLASGPSGFLNQPSSLPLNGKKATVEQDPNWDYHLLTINNFGTHFQKHDVLLKDYGGDNPVLDKLKNSGGKLLTWHGANDNFVIPYISWEYWTRVFNYYGGPANTNGFMRAFQFSGVGHCGGGAAPQPPAMFDALVNWVENGNAPDYLIGTQNLGGGVVRTRKVCKYPDEAVYNGNGSTDDEANFHCVVNAAEPADLAAFTLATKRFNQAP